MQTCPTNQQDKDKMVQDFTNWIKFNQKDVTGSTLAHACASTNSFELAVVILKANPHLLEVVDNFGRTPLSWALHSGSVKTCCYLLSLGAKLYHQDDALDTPLHIAAQQENIEEIKTILFWALKNDNETKSQARIILHTLSLKNNKLQTPIDIAMTLKNEELSHLLKGIQSICQDKLNQIEKEKYIFVKDITMRSGAFNGHNISKLDSSITGVGMEFVNDSLILMCYKKYGNHLKVVIKMDQVAFLILEKVHQRAELTLSSSPNVYSYQNDEWKQVNTSIFNSGLSFHCLVHSGTDLNRIEKSIGSALVQFQQGCWCFKTKEEKVSTLPSKNKIGILRAKIHHLHPLTSAKVKQDEIKTDFNLHTLE